MVFALQEDTSSVKTVVKQKAKNLARLFLSMIYIWMVGIQDLSESTEFSMTASPLSFRPQTQFTTPQFGIDLKGKGRLDICRKMMVGVLPSLLVTLKYQKYEHVSTNQLFFSIPEMRSLAESGAPCPPPLSEHARVSERE